MKLEDFLKLKDPSKVPKEELLQFHLRLHQWFGDGKDLEPKLKSQIIKAHTLVWFEFVRRSIRHKCMSELDHNIDEKIFNEEYPSYATRFIDGAAAQIPDDKKCTQSVKNKLIDFHTSIHTLVNLVLGCGKLRPVEEFYNAHDTIVDFLTTECNWTHPTWDYLDKPMFSKVFFYSNGTKEKPEVLTLFEFLNLVPDRIVLVRKFAQMDLEEKKIKIAKKFGSKLVQVTYFRLLRFLRPRDWDFKIVDKIDEPDLEYDLVLRRMRPFLTIHLSLSPYMFGDEVILTSPYLFLVGGLASRGFTSGDIDLLLREGINPDKEIRESVRNAFPSERDRISFVADKGLAPYTSYVGLMDLVLQKSADVGQIKVVEEEES